MPLYICQEGQSNKYWRYDIDGLKVTCEWARVGREASAERLTKTFSSVSERDAFIAGKIREKEKKKYRLVTAAEHAEEASIAQELGTQYKIHRVLWVAQRSATQLEQLSEYDPNESVYVEVVNSYSRGSTLAGKEVIRLLLTRKESHRIYSDVVEQGQTLTVAGFNKAIGMDSGFVNAVRRKLKAMAQVVVAAVATIKVGALGARGLFDDDEEMQAAAAPVLAQFTNQGMAAQVVSKFASLGRRALEL